MHVHAISADGPTVLTERTDVLQWGRLRVQFWICGRFDVHDGQIVLWREYYDPLTILTATMRGLLGTGCAGGAREAALRSLSSFALVRKHRSGQGSRSQREGLTDSSGNTVLIPPADHLAELVAPR
jgi:hypothetical protein